MTQEKYQPSPEESVELEKSRAAVDTQLIRGGAEFSVDDKGERTLEVTKRQITRAEQEMNEVETPDLKKELSSIKVDDSTYLRFLDGAWVLNEIYDLHNGERGIDSLGTRQKKIDHSNKALIIEKIDQHIKGIEKRRDAIELQLEAVDKSADPKDTFVDLGTSLGRVEEAAEYVDAVDKSVEHWKKVKEEIAKLE